MCVRAVARGRQCPWQAGELSRRERRLVGAGWVLLALFAAALGVQVLAGEEAPRGLLLALWAAVLAALVWCAVELFGWLRAHGLAPPSLGGGGDEEGGGAGSDGGVRREDALDDGL